MKLIFFFLSVILLFSEVAFSQELQPGNPGEAGFSAERLEHIDEMLQGYISEGKIAGAVALIARNGKIVYHKGLGYDKNAIFRIASQSKAVTSVAVMMLYEEGKLLLDDPVSVYIPEFKDPQVLDDFNPADSSYTTVAAKREVTVRDLLTHTSGLDYPVIGSKEAKAIYAKAGIPVGFEEKPFKLGDKMKILAGLPLMHQPGEKFTYGLNTDMLGYLVEVISGQSLAGFFRERIFEPLGMEDTYFYLPGDKQERLAEVYTEGKEGRTVDMPQVGYQGINKDYPVLGSTYYSGGAGLVSTAHDYTLFLQMLLNGGEYGGERLLSPHTIRLITTNQIGDLSIWGPDKFGLGFQVTTRQGAAAFPWHKGSFSWGGYYGSHYWADPGSNLTAIILTQEIPNTEWPAISAKFKNMVYSALME